jgi:hypothetical protein
MQFSILVGGTECIFVNSRNLPSPIDFTERSPLPLESMRVQICSQLPSSTDFLEASPSPLTKLYVHICNQPYKWDESIKTAPSGGHPRIVICTGSIICVTAQWARKSDWVHNDHLYVYEISQIVVAVIGSGFEELTGLYKALTVKLGGAYQALMARISLLPDLEYLTRTGFWELYQSWVVVCELDGKREAPSGDIEN